MPASEYLDRLCETVRSSKDFWAYDEIISKIASVIVKSNKVLGTVWVLGNGGSMAVAQHFALDLLKTCSIRAIPLNCPSLLTAYANDDGFEMVFYEPLFDLKRDQDIIFIFSCSGNSRNYIEFFGSFGKLPNVVISVVGTNGGILKEKSDICLHIESMDYRICETAFSIASDLIIERILKNENIGG